MMNTLMLSRIQFGLTISFHYLFPPLSIGLAHLAWLLFMGNIGSIDGLSGHERYGFMNPDDVAGIVTTEEIGFNI